MNTEKLTRLLIACALVGASSASAQSVPRTILSKPDASFPEPFSSVVGVRELANGRVVLSDRLEQTISILDLAAGDITPIGRQGQGPGEYGMPGPLYAFPGDSTLMVDFGTLRAVLIAGDRLGRSIPLTTGDGLPMIPRAGDARGRLYGSLPAIARGTGTGITADSTPITRLDPASGTIDTAAWMRSSSGGAVTAMRSSGGGQMRMMGMRPYAAEDGWAVAPDGRVALVHADDYHVEWIATDGRRVAGPPLPFTPVKIGKAEKEEWADRMSGGTAVMIMRGGSGGGAAPPPAMHPPRPNIDEQDWPGTKPPFVTNGLRVSPEGELWIQVSQPAAARGELWDVVDARGRRVRQVLLPDGRRFVGFGKGTLYAVRSDADDLEWLERYRR